MSQLWYEIVGRIYLCTNEGRRDSMRLVRLALFHHHLDLNITIIMIVILIIMMLYDHDHDDCDQA